MSSRNLVLYKINFITNYISKYKKVLNKGENMSIKINLTAKQVLTGITAIVTGVNERKTSEKYDNAKDVAEYPYLVKMAIMVDKNNVNNGQMLNFKLKKVGDLKAGKMIDFAKSSIKNDQVNLWANQRGYVQVSIKGDEIIAG